MSRKTVTMGQVFVYLYIDHSGLSDSYRGIVERMLYSGKNGAYCIIDNKKYDVEQYHGSWNVYSYQGKYRQFN